jgi:hypothetical protein
LKIKKYKSKTELKFSNPHSFTLWNFAIGEPAAGGIPQGRSAIKLLQYSNGGVFR